jgi:hypothetical protein
VGGVIPSITTMFQLATPEEIVDLTIACGNGSFTFTSPPVLFRMSGISTLTCAAGTFAYSLAGVGLLVLKDYASLGDGSNPVIQVQATGNLSIGVATHYPGGGLRANALAITAGGSVTIYRATGSFVDDSYYGMAGVTVVDEPLALPLSIGAGANATGVNSLAVGENAQASGVEAMVLGGNAIGSADYSTTFGPGALGRYAGALVHSSAGELQTGLAEYGVNIFSNATLPMTNIGGTCLETVAGVAYSIECRILAWQTAGVGLPGVWVYELLVHNVGGILTIDNQILTRNPALQNANAWTFAFTTDLAAELVINVTGAVGETMTAMARLFWAEVQP